MNATTKEPRQLSTEMQLDVPVAFAGKLFAYVAVAIPGGYGLGVAVANERGYSPIHAWHYLADTYEKATAEALRLNSARGLTEDAALDVILSTMRMGAAR